MKKYVEIARIAASESIRSWPELVGRVSFYGIILVIFSRLWLAVLDASGNAGASAANMVWYLAVTEWIVLSIPMLHLDVEHDFRSGDIAYQLARPTSYIAVNLSRGFGIIAVRLLFLGVTGFLMAWGLSGQLPVNPRAFLMVMPLGVLSLVLCSVMITGIGVLAFWVHDASPLYWIWQKLLFVFGGLILPLSVYPNWLQSIAKRLPFSAMLNDIAWQIIEVKVATAGQAMFKLTGWLIIATLAVNAFYKLVCSNIEINGG